MGKHKILYVEDYPVVQEMYVEVLRSKFEVEVASDGKQALELATTNQYDLILLDLLLPHVTGLEFLADYRKKVPSEKAAKVVVLTDFDNPETIKEANELNIEGYWIKVEHTPHVLVDKIIALLK